MMDRPSLPELIGAVREFLESQAIPQLQGHTAFHARVAVNALAIAERELVAGPAAAGDERSRLMSLLEAEGGDLDDLNRELCARIAGGRMGMETPGLVAHLERTTLDKVAIDQPRYSGLVSARARIGRL